ncbi:DNA polymerase subunit gamma-2 [Gastrophryne carolinensis]
MVTAALGLPQSRRLSDDQACRQLVDVCRRRGFLLGETAATSSSVLGGHQSLGPLGIAMKKNLVEEWWDAMVLKREQVLPISTPYHQARDMGTLRRDLLQGILQAYPPCLQLMNRKLPFGIAEVGRCFHPIPSEEMPDASRIEERTAAALVWFCSPRTSAQWQDYWLRHRLLWWQKFAQVPSRFSSSDHLDEEGKKESVIYYQFPWGKELVESLSSRGDSAVTQMHSGSNDSLQGRDGRKSFVPHVVWLSGDVERGMLAYLSDALQVAESTGLRGKEQRRTALRIHPSLAPIKVAVDVGKGPAADLRLICQGLSSELRESGISVWPGYLEMLHAPMEHLFTKYDEMGVPFTALISDVTLESGLLQLRNRDTTIRETMHISKLTAFLKQHMATAKRL